MPVDALYRPLMGVFHDANQLWIFDLPAAQCAVSASGGEGRFARDMPRNADDVRIAGAEALHFLHGADVKYAGGSALATRQEPTSVAVPDKTKDGAFVH